MINKLLKPATGTFFLLITILLMPVRAESEAPVIPETIRVGLAQDVAVQEFSVSGKYKLVDKSGKVIAGVLPGEHWQARFAGGKLDLARNGKEIGSYSDPVIIQQAGAEIVVLGAGGVRKKYTVGGSLPVMGSSGQAADTGSGSLNVISGSGQATIKASQGLNLVSLTANGTTASYRGDMEIRPLSGGLTVINELSMEEYLYGVVPSEMPSSWPAEALKAQVVAARTYAVSQLGSYGTYGFDLLATQQNQVYRGYIAENESTGKAVDETRGQVLTYNGEIIRAFFHSSSGGYVECCQDVWREELGYLCTKEDPYDKNDNHYNWSVKYTQDQLIAKLAESELTLTSVDNIEIMEKTASGARAKKLKISGTGLDGKPVVNEVFNADLVRKVLGLKSALFELSVERDGQEKLVSVIIKGSGYGHGLGMSQYGALGMAKQGYNYQDILKYYYNNTLIKQGSTSPVVSGQTNNR